MDLIAHGVDALTVNSNHALKPVHQALAAVAAFAFALSLAACATPTVPGGPGNDSGAPSGDVTVIGTGTVLQKADAAPEFCLGAVMESYPPQCSGIELAGWEWGSVEGQETSGDVTWGSYAVWGDYDGDTLTVSDTVMLALYDPMFVEDPATLPENAGDNTDAELITIQDSLHADAPFEVLMSSPSNGYLFATVVFDDGTQQEWADNRYGPDIVQIRSALTPVSTTEE